VHISQASPKGWILTSS